MKSFKALLLLFGAAVAYLPSPSVLTPPPIITAGVETPIEFNFSASSCSSSFDSERGCDWPFFRPFLVADPTFDNSDQSNVFVQEYMCKPQQPWEFGTPNCARPPPAGDPVPPTGTSCIQSADSMQVFYRHVCLPT